MAPSLRSAASLALAISVIRGYTWPDEKTDYLEGMLFEHGGLVARTPAAVIAPCPGVSFRKGRNTTAEWLRTVYHDMANADVAAGTGGINATGPGPSGVPTPDQDITSHTGAFARQGFNES